MNVEQLAQGVKEGKKNGKADYKLVFDEAQKSQLYQKIFFFF